MSYQRLNLEIHQLAVTYITSFDELGCLITHGGGSMNIFQTLEEIRCVWNTDRERFIWDHSALPDCPKFAISAGKCTQYILILTKKGIFKDVCITFSTDTFFSTAPTRLQISQLSPGSLLKRKITLYNCISLRLK